MKKELLIQEELNGDGCLLGYRVMWRLLTRKYLVQVQQRVVQRLLREIDLEGSNERQSLSLKPRESNNPVVQTFVGTQMDTTN